MSESLVDTRFYQVATPGSLAERLVIKAREAIYRDFIRIAQPTPHCAILDVGVSDVVNDAANMLERRYPFPDRLTAAGLGTAAEFQMAFPDVNYVQIVPGEALPYPDRHFAMATSNAVLEHVGSPEAQAWFIRELVRVSRSVFLTVPHRFFPVEHHTGIPLLHWADRSFRLGCRLTGKGEWAEPSNLLLMSRRRLASLFAPYSATIGFTGLRLGPFSSNLYAHVRSG